MSLPCRRVIPLLKADAVVSEWPIVGLWVHGVPISGSASAGFHGLDHEYVPTLMSMVGVFIVAVMLIFFVF